MSQKRCDAIAAALPELRQLLRHKPQLPMDFVAETLKELVGQFMLKAVSNYIADPYRRDEFEGEIEERIEVLAPNASPNGYAQELSLIHI